jgi:hypothetical protein
MKADYALKVKEFISAERKDPGSTGINVNSVAIIMI